MSERTPEKMSETQQSAKAKKSLVTLLVGVFVRPRATFTHLRDHQPRSWWLPAVLIVICTILPLWAGIAVANRPRLSGPAGMMYAEEGAVMIEKGGGPIVIEGGIDGPQPQTPTQPAAMNVLKIAGAVVGQPLTWLLWGGALYLASVFLGRSSSFKDMFRLTVWAWMPYAVRGLAQTIYIWSSGQTIVNTGFAGYVIDRSVPQFIPPGPGTLALAGVLGRVDIFLVWNLILLVAGLRAFTNLPRRKAISAILSIWIVLALLSVVPAIVGGLFGSMTM